jgi:hypothetical protein
MPDREVEVENDLEEEEVGGGENNGGDCTAEKRNQPVPRGRRRGVVVGNASSGSIDTLINKKIKDRSEQKKAGQGHGRRRRRILRKRKGEEQTKGKL